MPDNSYVHLLNNGGYSQLNVGTALANSTSATDISPGANTSGQAFQFNADYLQPGQQYRVRARGVASNTGTPNLTIGVYYGGVAGVSLAATAATATVASLSNSPWSLDVELRVESVGTSGTIRALGSVAGLFSGVVLFPSPLTSTVTVDTSTTKILTLGATWGTASASNSIQCLFYAVERLEEGSS